MPTLAPSESTTESGRPASLTATAAPPRFERLYREAGGNAERIPWDRGEASPALVNWLNAVAPSLVRCGARVAVVGCGLGHDARALIRRGYEVTAFDASPTAVRWAQRLDGASADRYVVADLLDPPARWRHRFDLVVEVDTLQSIPREQHQEALASMGDLLSPHGRLLVIAQGREPDEPATDAGPPWLISEQELGSCASLAGLQPEGGIAAFHDDGAPPVLRLRGVWRRG